MPILVRGNNKYNLTSISWEITHTVNDYFPNVNYFIGVVSNKNTDFSNVAWKPLLTDAHGISGRNTRVYSKGKNHIVSNYKAYTKNWIVKVEYKINESKLVFTQGNGTKLYEMTLP
eukprot:534003_1